MFESVRNGFRKCAFLNNTEHRAVFLRKFDFFYIGTADRPKKVTTIYISA